MARRAHPPVARRRSAAVLERATRRYELGWSPCRAADRIRARCSGNSLLLRTPCDAAGDHRLGASQLPLRRDFGRRTAKALVRPLLPKELESGSGLAGAVGGARLPAAPREASLARNGKTLPFGRVSRSSSQHLVARCADFKQPKCSETLDGLS